MTVHPLYAAAADPATPPDTLRDLALLDNLTVRRILADNPAAPGDLLAHLLRVGDENTRSLVATNANLPAALHPVLAADPCWEVRDDFTARTDLDDDIRTLVALAGTTTVGYIT